MSLIVITGAAGGIGMGIATRLAASGHPLLIADRDADGLHAASAELAGHVAVQVCDVSSAESVQGLAAAAQASGLWVGGLVNCAGVLAKGSIVDTSLEEWNRVIACNLTGAFLCTQAIGRLILKSGLGGAIVNVASVVGGAGQANTGAYSVSKAGLISLTQVVASEWGPLGVRCNAVSPGLIRTPMTAAAYEQPGLEAARAERLSVPRIGEPSDIASCVEFLLGDGAGYINGQNVFIDGGLLVNVLSTVPGGDRLVAGHPHDRPATPPSETEMGTTRWADS